MKNLILTTFILLIASVAFGATSLETCIDRAKNHSAWKKDGAMKDCAQYISNLDDCITLSTMLTRVSQDNFIYGNCLGRATSGEQCIQIANRIKTNPGLKDRALGDCNRHFPIQ